MKGRSKKTTLLAASIAGLVAIAGAMANAGVVYAADVHCWGVNACKGEGECGGKGHGCAGKNECKGLGWVAKAADQECLDAGGRLTEEQPDLPAATPVAG